MDEKEIPQKPAAKEPLYLMRHPHTKDTQGVNTQAELIPLMMRGYEQINRKS